MNKKEEIFTIGDKCEKGTIMSFSIFGNDLLITYDNGYTQPLKYAKKCKLPLFTTEDGIDIYKGDTVTTVLLSTIELYTIDGLVGYCTTPAKGFKYFSTKEKAQEYIDLKKPKYSLSDILISIPKGFENYKCIEEMINNLKDLK